MSRRSRRLFRWSLPSVDAEHEGAAFHALPWIGVVDPDGSGRILECQAVILVIDAFERPYRGGNHAVGSARNRLTLGAGSTEKKATDNYHRHGRNQDSRLHVLLLWFLPSPWGRSMRGI